MRKAQPDYRGRNHRGQWLRGAGLPAPAGQDQLLQLQLQRFLERMDLPVRMSDHRLHLPFQQELDGLPDLCLQVSSPADHLPGSNSSKPADEWSGCTFAFSCFTYSCPCFLDCDKHLALSLWPILQRGPLFLLVLLAMVPTQIPIRCRPVWRLRLQRDNLLIVSSHYLFKLCSYEKRDNMNTSVIESKISKNHR